MIVLTCERLRPHQSDVPVPWIFLLLQLLTVHLEDVMAFAFRMVRSDDSEYLGIHYGKIMKISRTIPAKGGRTKLENQTSIHWDDRDATFLCKWFEPVSISPTNDAHDAPKLVKGKTKSSQSVGASTSTAQVVPKAVEPHGCQLYTSPITSRYGFNWEAADCKAAAATLATPPVEALQLGRGGTGAAATTMQWRGGTAGLAAAATPPVDAL
ncbi:hypothetical protein CEUSTIGMA_g13997.t1 [Chlamydomonas eustigma]|uniref:Uncharacterized protein n=1 Tax=Chlamydomonas eustigma TaxID=1157962 RepID=A0A250XUE2_9CHLO|nr:hypothetical protein CEUSTIGMA_g13997.t1 [Chlamydomonas eustigma]|eukprot:GAX86589.1 hypothetical protein CEUSTIGMA_g13997.t1 [Chlamydomonas eustigma]